jgi:hypothetical protein
MRCGIPRGPPQLRSLRTSDRKRCAPSSPGFYKLTKWAVTLCVFKDVSQLDAGGESVVVTTDLCYGPVPCLLTDHVVYRRKFPIGASGLAAKACAFLGPTGWRTTRSRRTRTTSKALSSAIGVKRASRCRVPLEAGCRDPARCCQLPIKYGENSGQQGLPLHFRRASTKTAGQGNEILAQ